MKNELAERFGEGVCDFADMSYNVVGRLKRMARKCEDPEILVRIKLLIRYIDTEADKIKRKLDSKMEKSNCCKALVIVDSGDEGTSCWICTKCGEACDILRNNE